MSTHITRMTLFCIKSMITAPHHIHTEASLSSLVFQLVREPVQALVQSVTTSGTGSLYIPVTLSQGMQPKLVRDLCCIHGIRQVLKSKSNKTGYFAKYTSLFALFNVVLSCHS